MSKMYKGVVVLESLKTPETIDGLHILNEKLDEDWHLITVEATEEQVSVLASRLKDGSWYAHFWHGDDVIVVFPNKVMKMKHSDQSTWQPVIEYGKSINIPEEQLDFPIDE